MRIYGDLKGAPYNHQAKRLVAVGEKAGSQTVKKKSPTKAAPELYKKASLPYIIDTLYKLHESKSAVLAQVSQITSQAVKALTVRDGST
ncbi:hypothetical protein MJD09_17350 [bacterium]|nr:hypothetical protein [bacterium]